VTGKRYSCAIKSDSTDRRLVSSNAVHTMRKKENDNRNEIYFLIGRVYHNYIGVLERELTVGGLGSFRAAGIGNVLFALFERDACIIKDLSERVQLTPSTLTETLRRMAKAGLIERHRDSTDGRASRIHLTKLGRSIEPKCRAVAEEIRGILESEMTPREVIELKKLLARMVDNLRRAANESDRRISAGQR